ncbi:phage tail protein [Pseudomonas aegrilactucae]
MDYPKSVPAIGLVNGRFVDENPATGMPGSLIPASWGNAVTEEVLGVIKAAGLKPSETDNAQLAKAFKAMIAEASALPIGSMIAFTKGTVPPGFLELDGSVQSSTAYPQLAAYLGTTFNVGSEPSGYFRLPETRGEALRGWDHGRGVDAGRQLGSFQQDALQNIVGALNSRKAASESVAGTIYSTSGVFGFEMSNGPTVYGTASSTTTSPSDTVKFDASKVVRTATETRMRNLAVMWCIKAWDAPVNQGNIDVSALLPLAAQATESKLGTAKVATLVQVEAGVADNVIVTPKKLRLGFSALFAVNGYVVLPSWLGGLIIQWGTATQSVGSINVTYPIPFPKSVYVVSTNPADTEDNYVFSQAVSITSSGFRTAVYTGRQGSAPVANNIAVSLGWLALGR